MTTNFQSYFFLPSKKKHFKLHTPTPICILGMSHPSQQTLTDRLHLFCPINIPYVWGGGGGQVVVGGLCLFMCVLQSVGTRKGRCLECMRDVCVCVLRMQPALPALRSAAKTIICDRSARVDSLLHDSLTLSDDQNRKKLTGRRVKVSGRGARTRKVREIDRIHECQCKKKCILP